MTISKRDYPKPFDNDWSQCGKPFMIRLLECPMVNGLPPGPPLVIFVSEIFNLPFL